MLNNFSFYPTALFEVVQLTRAEHLAGIEEGKYVLKFLTLGKFRWEHTIRIDLTERGITDNLRIGIIRESL